MITRIQMVTQPDFWMFMLMAPLTSMEKSGGSRGRQVISWGEALMLQGGIAFAQNRVDSGAATAPGVELKEIFLPTGAVYGSFAASESINVGSLLAI
jgi:hypothetical protein